MFSKLYIIVGLALQLSSNYVQVRGHGRLLEPPNRSSIWRFPEFSDRKPPVNYDDNALYCGNYTTHYEVNGGKCGVCGDPYNQPRPRDNEEGGIYYAGIIVRGYKSGQIIPVEVELTATHYGYFEFRLCAKNDPVSHLDQACYDQHLLQRTKGLGTRYYIRQQSGTHYATYNLTLPTGVVCSSCVLQWHYETGNRWGTCQNGTEGLGCGPQEVFRGCSDVIILP
ncbi:uncharacterized protein LOC118435297 [Folsomia candida]|uniref:Chitin-binding type-4 domain-containing protein n=1 Tax=Folsomia candida TaxID=158441 RepID=A0A226EDH3_FOLCA|nr:uncharacterized protein LOC118435297 [Folsomia candida]OXA55288.1 hypothetical protein Fcan01_09569 [Folsomia candida]